MKSPTTGPCGLDCLECPYPECRAESRGRAARMSPEAREKNRLKSREWRELMLARGMCVACGKEPAMAGRQMCRACNARLRASYRERRAARIAAGLCVRCGKEPSRPGLLTCQACGDATKAYKRREGK